MIFESNTFTYVLVTSSITLFILVLMFIKHKRKVVIAILCSAVYSGIGQTFAGKVYVIKEELNGQLTAEAHRIIGNTSWPLSNGKQVKIYATHDKVGIINNSSKFLVLEEIIYTRKSSSLEVEDIESKLINPQSFKEVFLPRKEIHYFFDEHIPDEIEERSLTGEKSKYWLHKME